MQKMSQPIERACPKHKAKYPCSYLDSQISVLQIPATLSTGRIFLWELFFGVCVVEIGFLSSFWNLSQN